jgi:predicted CXXCH cytochrome family protein
MLKTLLLVGLALVVTLSAGVSFAYTYKTKAAIPEYLGSQACLGCHTDKWASWEPSGHAQMLVAINSPSDLPAPVSAAPAELQAELLKAEFIITQKSFAARDASGQLKYLGVTWDPVLQIYKAAAPGRNYSTECAGCHTTNGASDKVSTTWTEPGIGCEACHGPGRDHVVGKGDKSKIVVNNSADTCGQCHGGNSKKTNANMMIDGTRWVVGYRPGMKLSDVVGLQLTPVDPTKPAPDSSSVHLRNYNMWAASAHGNSMKAVLAYSPNGKPNPECLKCHSADVVVAAAKGKTADISHPETLEPLTCTACHDPHGGQDHQLRLEPEKLCVSCHANEAVAPGKPAKAGSSVYESNEAALKGYGAIGIKETESFHSEFTCVECHMTQGNHLFKVIRPDAPELEATRADTCTTCHKDSTKDVRAAYLQQWQGMFDAKMPALQADLKLIGDALKADPKVLSADLKAKYDVSKTNLSIINNDGSHGAHNFEYAMKIMGQAQKDLAAVKASLPK